MADVGTVDSFRPEIGLCLAARAAEAGQRAGTPETGFRNIVLFSDGTGNSSASLFKTNVRRLYEALDLADPRKPRQPRQFAFYDDGVGTSSFRPLAVLGGAFGYGLARNVRDLYAFLCRTYRPGDRIYAFGFSRGAFTVRVAVGLIMSQGIVRYDGDEAVLARNVAAAFRAYRKEKYGSSIVAPRLVSLMGRPVRDAILEINRRVWRRPRYDKTNNEGAPCSPKPVEVEFVGVWDTVDAYGLPIEELTRAVDTLIVPLTMPDADLNKRVKRARHALSLDDQRNTFHPRLWNEAGEEESDRIKQVWFAGVHADVGGGYPDDGLSHVSLLWMMDEVEAAAASPDEKLRFTRAIHKRLRALEDENGPMHDSRRGLASYYRYKPRSVEALAKQPATLTRRFQVAAGRPKIHQSVLRRIKVGQDGYAPISLQRSFDVELVGGGVVDGDAYLGLTTAGRKHFNKRQEHVWNFVWWRRVAYFITLGGTLALASLPLFLTNGTCESQFCFLSPAILGAGALLPGFASTWTHVFASNPATFLAAAAVIGIGTAVGRRLDVRVPDEMRRLWYKRTNLAPERHGDPEAFLEPRDPGWVNRTVETVRKSRLYRAIWTATTRVVLPTGALALAALLLLGAANAISLSATESWGQTCRAAAERVRLATAAPVSLGTLDTTSFCQDMRLEVEDGASYRIRLTTPARPGWSKEFSPGTRVVSRGESLPAGPNGIRPEDASWRMSLLAPFRRHLWEPWHKLMARVGERGADVHALDWRLVPGNGEENVYEAVLRAKRSGPLFLYANDLAPVFALGRFYGGNRGTATVQASLIGSDGPR